MKLLELTLPTAAENVALDEALLDAAERQGAPLESLRLWESPAPAVIVGRASKLAEEVNLEYCRRKRIPVVRRSSGGAAIVAGPGCLMYAVVLSYELRPQLRAIDAAHRFVLDAVAAALAPRLPGLARQGTSDLSLGDRKVSGNAMRAKRDHLLYHGTLLYDFDLQLVGRCLLEPPRRPEYRRDREHAAFVANMPVGVADLRYALIDGFRTNQRLEDWPSALMRRLVAERYAQAAWNEQW